jgi:hypothetical protein
VSAPVVKADIEAALKRRAQKNAHDSSVSVHGTDVTAERVQPGSYPTSRDDGLPKTQSALIDFKHEDCPASKRFGN